MNYAEQAYFDNNHCKHVVDWEEYRRLTRKMEEARRIIWRNGR
ncbi:MAG TPA: hypothetical protein VN081_02365 [Dongiaceae bacterium]|nr:hypothetical protein [Dongiaceae bacterium]